MYQKYSRVILASAMGFVLAVSGPALAVAATQTGFSTSQFVRVSSDVPDVAFERGLIVEISNAERGTYLEATSIVSPVSGNSASGSVTIREVTWTKDWSDRCSNERFNSKDCTFSFDDSTNRARLEVPSQERTYVVKVGQTISIPARNVMTPAANNNKGEDGYYVLTLRGVNYAQNPVATFRASPQRNPGSNPASSGGTSVSVSVASTGSGIAANPAFSVPVRTPGMSQTEYLYSVQATYLKALGQLQSLAGQLSQSADTVNRETGAETQTTGSGSGASAPQATAAQGELAQLSLRLSALQSQLMGGAASAASTGSFAVAAQPAQASTVPAANQECGPSTYENVDGEWKYVGCAGYYGQGAGNKQVNVAAGYKGADPSNAVQGSLGYYDEDGVYHSDAAFDRARDADPEVDVRAGQLGVDYCPLSNGFKTICSISYYDPEGVKLTQGTFDPASILTVMDRFGIDREQLEDLEKGMEKKNIPHLPGEMFPGTGSDAGINLTDLANGGLGTAYDWRVDPFCQIKGPTACAQVKANAALADALDIEPNRKVTDTDSTSLEAQLANLKREATALQNKI